LVAFSVSSLPCSTFDDRRSVPVRRLRRRELLLKCAHQDVAFADSFQKSFDDIVLCGDLLVLDVELFPEDVDDRRRSGIVARCGFVVGFRLRAIVGNLSTKEFLGDFPGEVIALHAKGFCRCNGGLDVVAVRVSIVLQNRIENSTDRRGGFADEFCRLFDREKLGHGGYTRLARPPLNLQSEELLSAAVERLLKALKKMRPTNVRQFFALANQHVHGELNDLARRLDKRRADVKSLERPEQCVHD
jgi:hypothetical protein